MTLTGNPELIDPGFDSLPENPMHLLNNWLKSAKSHDVCEYRGMVLSTIDEKGLPSSRVVLLRDVDDEGVFFGTNQKSAKGKDLKANPIAAGNLWWRESVQQINFRGRVIQLSAEKSDEVFKTRPREGQAIETVSSQSLPLEDEDALYEQMKAVRDLPGKIPRTSDWFVYKILIERIEFWVGSIDRLHRRIRYDLTNGRWHNQALQP